MVFIVAKWNVIILIKKNMYMKKEKGAEILMKKRRNISISVLLIFGMFVCMLTGCSGKSGKEEEVTEIEILQYKQEAAAYFEKVEEKFNATHKNIRLKIESPNDASTIMRTRFIREDYPDIIGIGGDINYSYCLDAEILMDISDYKGLDEIKESYKEIDKNLEFVPTDELIPYIDEMKEFSLSHFGALPHLTIARDDRTEEIGYLTKLTMEEYDQVWSQFNSSFWEFKKSIFGIRENRFCYAGKWSCYINLTNGNTLPCYFGNSMGNVFEDPDSVFPEMPVGKCELAHCYNGHVYMTFGIVPGATTVGYGDIRDRLRTDGTHWLQPELKAFFNTKLNKANKQLSIHERANIYNGYYAEYLTEIWHKLKRNGV